MAGKVSLQGGLMLVSIRHTSYLERGAPIHLHFGNEAQEKAVLFAVLLADSINLKLSKLFGQSLEAQIPTKPISLTRW